MVAITELNPAAVAQRVDRLLDAGPAPMVAVRMSPPGARDVELIGPQVRLTGWMSTGHFRRMSDFINLGSSLLLVRDARLAAWDGVSGPELLDDVLITPSEVTLIAEYGDMLPTPADVLTAKRAVPVLIVTPGHRITGRVFLAHGAELDAFVSSREPAFVPLADLEVRALGNPDVVCSAPFGLLNRRHIVAVSTRHGAAPGAEAG